MSGIDIPHLVHEQNMANQQPHTGIPPPGYRADAGGDQVHTHHYFQIQAEQPPAKPWYKRKRFIYTCLCLVIFALLIAIVSGVVVVIALKEKEKAAIREKESFSNEAVPTVDALQSDEVSSASEAPKAISTTLASSTSTPFVMTVTLVETKASATTEDPKTLTRTVTQSDEKIGAIISSLLSEFPQFTTEVVTKTVSPDEEENEGTQVLSTEAAASSATESSKETTTASDSVVELRSTSSTKTRATPSSEAAPTSTPASSSLSIGSGLIAVDVNNGPSESQRRLVLWQDTDKSLIARDSAQGETNVYRIDDQMDDSQASMPASDTPLTAASDDDGVIHVFYIGEENQIIYITQDTTGQWKYRGDFFEVAESSSISATWHSSEGSTRALVLAYVDLERSLHFYVSSTPDDIDSWKSFGISDIVDLAVGDWAGLGLAIASGLQYDPDWEPGTGEYCGVYVILEGDDAVEAVECSFEEDEVADCYVLEDTFSRYDEGPSSISSHPTFLAWSRTRPENGAPPTVYGFMTLEKSTMSLLDHRFIPRVPEPSPTGDATNLDSDMETYEVIDRDIDAITMTDEKVLFARSGSELFELELVDGEWKTVREVDTRIGKQ